MLSNIRKQLHAPGPARRISMAVLGWFIIAFAVSCVAVQNQDAGLTPPQDFQPVAEIDLSAGPYSGKTFGQFTLDETAFVGIFFTLQNIDTPYFDLRLQGTDGDGLVILHSEDYRTDENGGGMWEKSLSPGTYRLVLTTQQSSGILSIYRGYK